MNFHTKARCCTMKVVTLYEFSYKSPLSHHESGSIVRIFIQNHRRIAIANGSKKYKSM